MSKFMGFAADDHSLQGICMKGSPPSKCLERSWHCITCMQRMSPASVVNNALKTLAALLTKAATVCASVGACPLQLPQGNRSINVRGNLDQPFDREGVRRFNFFHCQVVAPIWVI